MLRFVAGLPLSSDALGGFLRSQVSADDCRLQRAIYSALSSHFNSLMFFVTPQLCVELCHIKYDVSQCSRSLSDLSKGRVEVRSVKIM